MNRISNSYCRLKLAMLRAVSLWKGVRPLYFLIEAAGEFTAIICRRYVHLPTYPDPFSLRHTAEMSGQFARILGSGTHCRTCSLHQWIQPPLIPEIHSLYLNTCNQTSWMLHSPTVYSQPCTLATTRPLIHHISPSSCPIILLGCSEESVLQLSIDIHLPTIGSPSECEGAMECSSVLKKRHKKMKKHKYKKWRKRTKFLRRRLGK